MGMRMKPTRLSRPVFGQLAGGCALSGLLVLQSAAAFTVAQNPPFLPTPMPPNIVMTFDDSSSMRLAYAPDGICSSHATRRAKSAAHNALYYNPAVRYDPPVSYDATTGTYVEYGTDFTAAYVNGFYPGHGTVNLETGYRPTWSYDPSRATADEGGVLCSALEGRPAFNSNYADHPKQDFTNPNAPTQAYYYVYDPVSTKCSSPGTENDDCYRRVLVSGTSGPNGTDERQNFANWYSFYRTRNLMTATAATRALMGVPPTARVGWQSLSSCNSTTAGGLFDSTCKGWQSGSSNVVDVDKRIKTFEGSHRTNLLAWLARLPANGDTPLRRAMSRAGEYFRTNGIDSPYAQNPTVSQGTEFSCRPNFHILMTDGIWNDSLRSFCGGSNCGNKDNTSIAALPDGTAYSTSSPLTHIYRDNNSDSVADIAFHYWATDLRPDLTNNLLPYRASRSGNAAEQYWNPQNDPATWQHVVTFTVGLGLSRTFTVSGIPWGGSTYAGTGYTNLMNGTASWPETGFEKSPGNVYDLWHAAINSRGQSFSADTPRDLSDALATALNRILERESAAAALATNSSRLATDTLLFQARFFSGTWTGSLTAYGINADGSLGNVKWETTAPGNIPAHDRRSIFTWGGSAGATFTESGLTAAGLWSSIGSTDLLNYLRGDASQEERNGGRYRTRGGPLGDIINSDPVFVFAENYGYRSLAEGSGYAAFVASKKSRRKMLYVGGNDGFLRAFDALTGQERFAYVPQAIVPNLRELADVAYGHRYYVDGSPTAWDAYFGGAWKTVLIGSTGAGGRSIFALDVTDPDAFGTSKVLWEINQNTPYRTGASGDAADPQYGARLGYTIGQAVVAKLNNGEWAAIFGNGYRSPGDQASLYIVRVSDGRLIRRIDTGVGSITSPNGLGTPTLHDLNGDDVYDVAYAPDMLGNVWKFDLTSTSPASWSLAFGSATGFPNGAPLFQARSGVGAVQPISARVELAAPPPGRSGIMVVFGTGRFFAVGDNTDTTGQTFYGIWDNGTRVAETNRSTLQAQTISTSTIELRGVSTVVRAVSANAIDWTTKRGWFIDLPTSMERVTGSAVVRGGRVIFTTLVPATDPCEFGGSGWLMEVDAATGTKLPYPVFDTTGDRYVSSADADVSGMPVGVGMVRMPLVLEGTPTAFKFLSGTKGEIQLERNRTFGPPLGRESWREVQR